MNEIMAANLKVQAFPRGIGANENTNCFLPKWSIESNLDAVSFNQLVFPVNIRIRPSRSILFRLRWRRPSFNLSMSQRRVPVRSSLRKGAVSPVSYPGQSAEGG
jgi:hypothetical protein